MSDMEYNTDDLRAGAHRSKQSSDAADEAAGRLRGAQVSPSPFGNVPIANAFAGALAQAQQDQVRGAATAAATRIDKAARADAVADAGDELTTTTAHVANQAVVDDIANRM